MRTFKQLSSRDRSLMDTLRRKGLSVSEIARRIGRHKSTVSREFRRNTEIETIEDQLFWEGVYQYKTVTQLLMERIISGQPIPEEKRTWDAQSAQRIALCRTRIANLRRRRKKFKTRNWVKQKLRAGWSPEQIAGRSKVDGPESVSYEFVYQLVKQDRKRGGRLYRLLKRFGKRKQRFSPREYGHSNGIPNRVGIENRPAIVDLRVRPGDLEADLIQGYKQDGYILTVVDRKTKYISLKKLKNKGKRLVREKLAEAINELGVVHTLTVDNGREFSDHKTLTDQTHVQVYFTQPYSSIQRGTVENTNGLIRYYLPKKTSFRSLTQAEVEKIEENLNTRPRKCLKFLTPKEEHFKSMGSSSDVAFGS